MSIQYQAVKDRDRYRQYFDAEPPKEMGAHELIPGYQGSFIRRHPDAERDDDSAPQRQALLGRFGLATPWAQDVDSDYKYLAIVRSEPAACLAPTKDVWRQAQPCIIPAESFYKKNVLQGENGLKHVSRASGKPMGIAGLWSTNKSPQGAVVNQYALLTINADDHPLMRNFYWGKYERRMVLILPEVDYDSWLDIRPMQRLEFIQNCPVAALKATPPFKSRATQCL